MQTKFAFLHSASVCREREKERKRKKNSLNQIPAIVESKGILYRRKRIRTYVRVYSILYDRVCPNMRVD